MTLAEAVAVVVAESERKDQRIAALESCIRRLREALYNAAIVEYVDVERDWQAYEASCRLVPDEDPVDAH